MRLEMFQTDCRPHHGILNVYLDLDSIVSIEDNKDYYSDNKTKIVLLNGDRFLVTDYSSKVYDKVYGK